MSVVTGRVIARSFLSVVLASLLALLSGPAHVAWAANMVANPGFESGGGSPSNWSTTDPQITLVRDTATFRSGAASLKVTDSTGTPNTPDALMADPIAVTAGTTYDFSYWYFLSPGHNIDFISGNLFFYSNAGCTSFVSPARQFNATDFSTGAWHQRSAQVTANAGAQCMQIQFQVSVAAAGSGVVNFDDVFFDVAPPGALQLSSPTYTVGEQGPTASITITRTDGTFGTVGATVNLTNGSATAPDDYNGSALSVSLANNETSTTVQVPIVDDLIDEDDETIQVSLVNPTGGATLGAQTTADLTIQDNDTAGVTVSPTSGLVTTEAGGTATFSVNLNSQPTQPVTIALSSSDTTEGTIAPAQSTLTFAADATAVNNPQTVTVTGVQDVIADGNVAYSIITGTTQSADPKYNNTINGADVGVTNSDDDTAGLTVTQSGGTTAVTEGGTTDAVSLVLTSQPSADVTVSFTADAQLQPLGSITFTGGPTGNWNQPRDVVVVAFEDAVAEGAHTGTIGLTVSSADLAYNGIAVPSVVVTITDNDTPGFTVNPTGGLTTTEAGGTAQFTVRLNTVPTAPVTIALASSDTTEGAVSPAQATLTFPADATALAPQAVIVTGVQDAGADGNVAYTLVTGPASSADPSYAGLDPADVGVTNADDEAAPGLSIDNVAVAEGTAGTGTLTFAVTLTPPSAGVVSVNFATADGAAPGGATGGMACTAGVDYVATGGRLSFQPNESSKTIAVAVCGDGIVEGNETLFVNLSGADGAAIADGQGQGTIQDDDGAPVLSISDATVAEGDAGTATLAFTVTLSLPSSQQVTVPFATANGTIAPATGAAACAANVDYLTTTGTVTFQPLDTSETITVTVCADGLVEGNETLLVNLGTPTGGATVADGQGAGTITDNDLAGGVSFGAATAQVPELAGSVTITVQRGAGAGPAATGNSAGAPAAPSSSTAVPGGSVVPGSSVRPNPPASTQPPAGQPAPNGGTVAPSALGTVTVTYATGDVTATAGQDYVATAGTLTFGVNETSKTITIPITVDSIQEGPEQFTVVLSSPTGGADLGAFAVLTVIIIDTTHGSSPPPGDDSADDERVERERETEEERRQRARTNQGNRDDDAVEGDVLETRCEDPWPSVVIANRDGAVEVKLIKEAQNACSSIAVGDYLEADGEKQHEGLFHADSVEIKRRR